jgi:histidine decarboxylase
MRIPTPSQVIDNAVGPYDDYAMGYGNPMGTSGESTGTGYIATMKVSVATVEMAGLDWGTQNIVSYDRCEAADANISQINMGTASSFCGLNGALWGLHLAKVPPPVGPFATTEDLFTSEEMAALTARGVKPSQLECYSGGPLLTAAERLFGHVDRKERRNPPLPGSHIICANKSATVKGPAYAWAFIAIAVPDNPAEAAHLFIEDCDKIVPDGTGKLPTPQQVRALLLERRKSILKSIAMCGDNYQKVTYKTAYIAGKAIYAGPTQVACALACAPYVLLPRNAVKAVTKPHDLANMSIEEWEKATWPRQTFTPSDTGKDGILVVGPKASSNGRAKATVTRAGTRTRRQPVGAGVR